MEHPRSFAKTPPWSQVWAPDYGQLHLDPNERCTVSSIECRNGAKSTHDGRFAWARQNAKMQFSRIFTEHVHTAVQNPCSSHSVLCVGIWLKRQRSDLLAVAGGTETCPEATRNASGKATLHFLHHWTTGTTGTTGLSSDSA